MAIKGTPRPPPPFHPFPQRGSGASARRRPDESGREGAVATAASQAGYARDGLLWLELHLARQHPDNPLCSSGDDRHALAFGL